MGVEVEEGGEEFEVGFVVVCSASLDGWTAADGVVCDWDFTADGDCVLDI